MRGKREICRLARKYFAAVATFREDFVVNAIKP
jgi:hypothetical protein